jgi:hypothetical protein
MSNNQPVKEELVNLVDVYSANQNISQQTQPALQRCLCRIPAATARGTGTGVSSSVQRTEILILQNRYKLFQILFCFCLLLKGANIKIYRTTNLQLNGEHPFVPKE